MRDNYDPEQAVRRCGSEHGVQVDPILKCGDGAEGQQLLAHAGRLTSSLSPKVNIE